MGSKYAALLCPISLQLNTPGQSDNPLSGVRLQSVSLEKLDFAARISQSEVWLQAKVFHAVIELEQDKFGPRHQTVQDSHRRAVPS
jgi:hypothetical protein